MKSIIPKKEKVRELICFSDFETKKKDMNKKKHNPYRLQGHKTPQRAPKKNFRIVRPLRRWKAEQDCLESII